MSTVFPATAPSVRPLVVNWDRVVLLVALVLLCGGLLVGSTVARSSAAPLPTADVRVVVQQGDTLWDLAREHGPAAHTASLEYVRLVEQHNGVRAGQLIPGTVVRLPVP